MKIRTTALFATAIFAVGSVSFANSFQWTLADSDTSGALLDIEPIKAHPDAAWQFVFLTNDNGTLTDNGGGQEWFDPDDYNSFAAEDGIVEGCWSDALDETATYVVALWDGISGSPWYAISDGEDYITIDAADFSVEYSPSPDDPGDGATQLQAIIQALLDGDYVAETVSSGDEPPTPLARRPAISTFAVTGNTATLTICDAMSGAWYAVFTSDTPDLAAAKTLLGQAVQAVGDTLTFASLDAEASAKFYFVTGASTKADAEVWQ